MILYLTHNNIDFDKWDECIDKSPNGIIYASSWYLNMTSPGWGALVEGDYQSVMPLPARRKFGIWYIFQPTFVQQLGVFSTQSLSSEVIRNFIQAVPGHFKWVHYNLNTYNPLKVRKDEKFTDKVTCELDLIPSYEILRKGYSKNTARNIKKAEKNNLFITHHGQPETIIDAFRNNKGKQFNNLSENDYFLLKHLIYVGIHRGLVKIRCAYTGENNFCAGIIFFESKNKLIFMFSGITDQARNNGAMFLLVDDFIREHAGRDLVLDFEGSSDPNLARFYLGFGSKECVFLQIKINRMPPVLKSIFGLWEKLR